VQSAQACQRGQGISCGCPVGCSLKKSASRGMALLRLCCCCRLAQEVLSRVDPNESFLKVLPQQVGPTCKRARHRSKAENKAELS